MYFCASYVLVPEQHFDPRRGAVDRFDVTMAAETYEWRSFLPDGLRRETRSI